MHPYTFNFTYGPNDFHLLPPSPNNTDAGPVHAIVLRAEGGYRKFAIAAKDTPLWIGDVVMTDPLTSLAIEMLIGARVGVVRRSTIKITSETRCDTLEHREFSKITLHSGGLFANWHNVEKPMYLQTRGGVMGIKG